mmetsp:Transcript_37499/g.68544  ORF Transcript_37499/g.68544 Transcript_37499/m.68544 type:complete len:392 (+) Transcript_37499:100-1275(+)
MEVWCQFSQGAAKAGPVRVGPRTATAGAAPGSNPKLLRTENLVVPGAVCGSLLSARACRKQRRSTHSRFSRGAVALRAAEDELEKARAAKEAAELELEAAKLRQELQEMEQETAMKRRKVRAERILSASSSGVSAAPGELLTELKKEGFDFKAEDVEELVKLTSRGKSPDASLGFEELSSELFEKELSALQERKRVAEMEELRQRQLKAEQERKNQEEGGPGQTASSTEEGEDDTQTKILSALAYLLPLAEGLQFAVPLLNLAPALSLLFAPAILFNFLITSIPFGGLIFVIIFTTAAQNRDLPRSLRFNLEQAVLMDIALLFPSFFFAGAALSGFKEASLGIATLSFVLLFIAVSWCVIKILLRGEIPDDIPFISKAAKNFVDSGTFFDR